MDVSGNKVFHIHSGSTGPVTKTTKMPERVKYHFDHLNKIIEEFKPNEIALEAIFYARNVKMAIQLAHKSITELHHFIVRFAFGIEVRAAFATAHRQCGQRILEDLFESQEFNDP